MVQIPMFSPRFFCRCEYSVEVSLNDLSSYDSELADKIRRSPAELMPLFEEAAKEIADEVGLIRKLYFFFLYFKNLLIIE